MKTLTGVGRTKIAVIVAALAATAAPLSAASAYQTVGAYVPCNFPHGWNSTDASHALEGTPDGDNHQCWVPQRPTALIPSVAGAARWRGFVGLNR
jgi:hypothetical protein